MALLGLLRLVAAADALVLTVGHVDHGLRAGAAAEAEHVAQLAASWGIPFAQRRLTLAPGPGMAARAREARHEALGTMARRCGAHRIALAHTATDQAETVLLQLTRGAGLRGLAGMRAVEPETRIRPILGLTRAETAGLCGHLGAGYVDDPTNVDPAHPRVRVRAQVLPVLSEIRGGVALALAASANAADEADRALSWWVDAELDRRRSPEGRYRVDDWARLPRGFRVRWIRAATLRWGVDPDAVGRRVVDAIDRGLLSGGAKGWDLRGGLRLLHRGGWLEVRCEGDS